ncbi:MAG: LPS export ABC transporter periplasmic protein LptC [Urechidicola sp.]|nr:LPS export ABC transporter periplasmic protein LptC [Urechidicola sp.]
MTKFLNTIFKSIAVIFLTAMLFSCGNNTKEIRDLISDKNLPIGIAENIYNIYTDSGRVTSRLYAPLLHNYSNRENHPYSEFPKGIKIVTYNEENDSIVVTGDYAIIYSKTSVSEIKENVVIINHVESKKLATNQLFWDQKTKYFYTEQPFTLYTETDTIHGTGFDASEDLKMFIAKNNRGIIYINENENE